MRVLKKYTAFKGRVGRAEFWTFSLINYGIAFLLYFLGSVFQDETGKLGFFYIAFIVFMLVTILPGIAVAVRRLHDTGKSGWWHFIVFIPLVGWLLLLVYLFADSEPGYNQYGPNPKDQDFEKKERKAVPGQESRLTMWVKDENPDKMYLIGLLLRIRAEHPETMSDEIKDMLDNKIPYDFFTQLEEMWPREELTSILFSSENKVILDLY